MKIGFVVLGLAIQGAAAAAQSCETYVGQIVAPLTFPQALAQIPKIDPKGEFETTAEFELRNRAAIGGTSKPLVLSKAREDIKFFEYDADTQQLGIKTYAFNNTLFMARDAFYGVEAAKMLEPDPLYNFSFVLSSKDTIVGTYDAQNAYGAKATITKVRRNMEVVFDRGRNYKLDGQSPDLFPAADQSPYMVGFLPLSPAEAQRLKPILKIAFVIEPKEPFVIENSYLDVEPTISQPREISVVATVLIADIKCGLVTDEKNVVLGAYSTR